MMWFHKRYLSWAVSGLLLGVVYVIPGLWILSLLGAALFLYLLFYHQRLTQLLLGAWLAWSIKSAFAMSWFWSTYPIDWLPIELGNEQILPIAVYWITASMWLGIGGAAVAYVVHITKQRKVPITWLGYLLLIPLIWVIGEVIGSVLFSIAVIGPGGGVNTSFSFGYMGYALAEHWALLQLGRVAGVYGLTFFFALLALCLFWVLYRGPRPYQYSAACIVAVVYVSSFYTPSPAAIDTAGAYTVLTIDTTFAADSLDTPADRIARSRALRTAVAVAATHNPDVIVLPEDSRFFDQAQAPSKIRSLFTLRYEQPSFTLVDSGRVQIGDASVLQAFIYQGPDQSTAQVQKRYLVPQGEYVPTIYSVGFRLLGFGAVVEAVSDGLSYERGTKTSQQALAPSTPGVLFCFESVTPLGVRALVSERPDLPFVVHPVSHSWFHDPEQLWHQLDTMLKVQAVWNQKYIVSAGNQMTGSLFTPRGIDVSPLLVEEGERWTVRKVVIPKE